MSAWALNYEIYEHGNLDYIGGTSASTPAVAGMFSLINDLRLQQQLPPLGFLNPALYTMLQTSCYNDILRGNNGDQPCCEGFTAQSGWDPMTGLGSPNFPALESFFMQSFPLRR
uniref:Peptidase S53 domain-containing protein n=2 Tax=Vannella robusta TaxID=1487602 RepID=A0A7S4I467_9EUKA|mmetsp:Transcript_19985/g.25271  ORF Transcript_19985/g.25271 Transcript_19985/m.25271 type:complete len:114 (+) Transcript_19985:487-828(+)